MKILFFPKYFICKHYKCQKSIAQHLFLNYRLLKKRKHNTEETRVSGAAPYLQKKQRQARDTFGFLLKLCKQEESKIFKALRTNRKLTENCLI